VPKTITLTIDENGDQIFLKSDGAEMFRAIGITVTRRASHVEPDSLVLRLAFRVARLLSFDAWTRTWSCVWRVNTAPIGGPILAGRWTNRQAAIAAEIQFLNTFFLHRRTQ
jgi:hypothetical protein